MFIKIASAAAAGPTSLRKAVAQSTRPIDSGWKCMPQEVAEYKLRRRALGKYPMASSYSDPFRGDSKGKYVQLLDIWEKVAGRPFEPHFQLIGDCVSHGNAVGIEVASAVQVETDGGQEWSDKISTEVVYGGSRVEIGKGQIRTDGSVGAWAAEFNEDYGTVSRGRYGDIDLTKYDANLAKDWGHWRGDGIPTEMETLSKDHPVGNMILIDRGWEQACDLMASGYPIVICSDQGFGDRFDNDGFLPANKTWYHCFPAGTVVATSKGMREIQDIQDGDLVWNGDGRLVEVDGTREIQTRKPMTTLKIANSPPIQSTNDHRFLVRRIGRASTGCIISGNVWEKQKNGALNKAAVSTFEAATTEWLPASDIQPDDWLLTPRNIEKPNMPPWLLDLALKSSLEDTLWLLGLIAGDGCCRSDGHQMHITSNIKDHLNLSRARAIFEAWGYQPRIRRVKGKNATRLYVFNSVLTRLFRSELYDSRAVKNFPAWAIGSEYFLQGLVDSDGCHYKGKIHFSSSSASLAHGVNLTLIQLGIPSSFSKGSDKDNTRKPLYQIIWGGSATGTSWFDDDYYYRRVKSVQHVEGQTTVYDLSVNDYERSFIANGVVAHNCMVMTGFDRASRREGGFIMNSWGDAWCHGRKHKNGTPPGGFWADARVVNRMVNQGDSYAVTDYRGVVRRNLDYLLY